MEDWGVVGKKRNVEQLWEAATELWRRRTNSLTAVAVGRNESDICCTTAVRVFFPTLFRRPCTHCECVSIPASTNGRPYSNLIAVHGRCVRGQQSSQEVCPSGASASQTLSTAAGYAVAFFGQVLCFCVEGDKTRRRRCGSEIWQFSYRVIEEEGKSATRL